MEIAATGYHRVDDAGSGEMLCGKSFGSLIGVALEPVPEESERDSSDRSGMELENPVLNVEQNSSSVLGACSAMGLDAELQDEIPVLGGIVGPEFFSETPAIAESAVLVEGENMPDEESGGWTRMERRGAMPDERATKAERVTSLEKALRGFAQRKTTAVVEPVVGLTYD